VDFNETSRSNEGAHLITAGTEGGNGGHEHTDAGNVEESGDFADSTYVLRSIVVTETQVTVESGAQCVAVQIVNGHTKVAETLLHTRRDR
jgi:hypothetical protein